MLDGEIIAGDGTLTSFNQMLSRSAVRTFVAFDVLAHERRAVIQEPIERRRRVLARSCVTAIASYCRVPSMTERRSMQKGSRPYEGVVTKRAYSVYRSGQRSRDWVKVKSEGATVIIRERFDRRG